MVRRVLLLLLTASVLLSCQSGKKDMALSSFWEGKTLLSEDISLSEEQFADFAELAVAGPREEALTALDALFDRLKAEDEVAYYIYSDWVAGAFYSPLSPCRDAELFAYCVGRLETDGILTEDEFRRFGRMRDWISLNAAGQKAALPQPDPEGRPTLVLVIDLSCPSCRMALDKLGTDPAWDSCRRLALCGGHGEAPDADGWEIQLLPDGASHFDLGLVPFYYVIDPAGVVSKSYTPAL